jgi:S-adenosylmethionine:tRNA ribosyltransferase-isomerase
MNVREFFFELPPELIAQEPPEVRGASRLLHVSRATGARTHSTIDRPPRFLDEGDLLVVNNTRVLPARLLESSRAERRRRRVPASSAAWTLPKKPGTRDASGQKPRPAPA